MKKHLLKNFFLALILFPASYLTASHGAAAEESEIGSLAVVAAARPYACDHCDKSFRTRSKLERHLTSHDGDKKLTCPKCDRRFACADSVRLHLIRHKDQNRTNVCRICNARFFFPNELEKHQRVHDGKKPFSCEHCDTEFTTFQNLCKHKKSRRERGICPKKRRRPDHK